MVRQSVNDQLWQERIHTSDRYYKEWASLFKCDILEKYYEGFQWKSQREMGYNPYTINKVFETIEIKIAEFIPTFPKYTVSAKPVSSEYDLDVAMQSSQLKEDVLNTIIMDNRYHFSEEVENAYKDSFFRFGMLEVGYAADWIMNPNAPKPLLKGDTQKLTGRERYRIKIEPAELPVNERVYFKHVSAKRFRVGGVDHKYLNRCGWVGYYDYVHKDDLLALPKLMNRDKLESTQGTIDPENHLLNEREGSVTNKLKLWYIWDLRSMMHLMIADSPALTVYQKKFSRLPLFDLRPNKRVVVEGYYPVPPVFHWLSAQDEINETREMLRAHEPRQVRKVCIIGLKGQCGRTLDPPFHDDLGPDEMPRQ